MANWGGAGTGALSGAATGATVGSVIPGVGTAIGAGIGAVGGGILGYLSGGKTKDQFKKQTTLTPEQEAFQRQYLERAQQAGQGQQLSQDYFNRILSGDQSAYDQFAAPYLQQFQEQTIPRLSEQFGALGGGLGGGVAGSSGFGQAIGGAGAGLNAQLASLYANLQNQAAQQQQGNYQNMANTALGNRSFENLYQPGNLGFGGQIAAGAGKGLGQTIGQNFGNQFGNLFKQNPMNNQATGTDMAMNQGY